MFVRSVTSTCILLGVLAVTLGELEVRELANLNVFCAKAGTTTATLALLDLRLRLLGIKERPRGLATDTGIVDGVVRRGDTALADTALVSGVSVVVVVVVAALLRWHCRLHSLRHDGVQALQ